MAGTEDNQSPQGLLTLGDAANVLEEALSDPENEDLLEDTETGPENDKGPDDSDSEDQSDDDSHQSDDDQTEPENDDSDDSTEPETYEVLVAGEPVRVTLEELQKGYSRTKDYTQKTQAVADMRREYEGSLTSVRERAEQYATKLKEVEETMAVAVREPDWGKLAKEYPEQYDAYRAEWDNYQRDLKNLQEKREQADADAKKARADEVKELTRRNSERLSELVPAWRDPDKRRAIETDLVAYARTMGLTNAEIGTLSDYRVIRILMDAAAHHKLRSNKSKGTTKLSGKTRTARPGGGDRRATQGSKGKRAFDRLRKSGTQADAASVLFEVMDD